MSGFVLEGGVTANCIDGTVEFSDANGDVADQPECIGIFLYLSVTILGALMFDHCVLAGSV